MALGRARSDEAIPPVEPRLRAGGASILHELPGLAELARRSGHDVTSAEPLRGDVGRRRYVRLRLADNRTVLGVVYPPEEADSRRRWVEAHALLKPRVRVPQLIADDGEGLHIVEDFGEEDLATRLETVSEERERRLEQCASAAAAIAGLGDSGINPPFDHALFRRELDLAREAVFDLYLGEPLSAEDRAAHDAWADALCREILEHPRALCHRDFHGNNLFPAEDEVASIDFQDLRTGPDSYDLASLLWERTTLAWMTSEVADAVADDFARRRRIDPSKLRERLDRVLLQRAWKVCGTFARAVAQGRGETYRRYLPGEIALVGRLLHGSGRDRPFRAVFERRLRTLC